MLCIGSAQPVQVWVVGFFLNLVVYQFEPEKLKFGLIFYIGARPCKLLPCVREEQVVLCFSTLLFQLADKTGSMLFSQRR